MSAEWCPFAERIQIPASNYQVGADDTLAVCLHIVDGSLTSCISWFKNSASGVSAHLGIGKDGRLVQFVSIANTAYAQGLHYAPASKRWFTKRGGVVQYVTPSWSLLQPGMSINRHVISIEHEGKPGEPLTPAMQATQLRLLRWLAEQTKLTYVVGSTLIGHFNLDNVGRKYCPGPAFDFPAIAMEANTRTEPDYTALWGTRFPYFAASAIAACWRDQIRLGTSLGEAVTDEASIADGYTVRGFVGGYVLWRSDHGAEVRRWRS